MKKIILTSLLILITLNSFADSGYIKLINGNIISYIDEDLFGDGGTIIIHNKGNKTFNLVIAYDTPTKYQRGIKWKTLKSLTIEPGEKIEIEQDDVVKTVYGLAIKEPNSNKIRIYPYPWDD